VVSERINDFFREFGIAIVAVILVTMLLLPLRVALVSAIAIPVSVSMTFGMLNACGIELQQVSISALIVVLGMVVDNAIVIVDNYVGLLDRKVPIDEAAERCATEMAVPVLTATLAIIAAFAPLAAADRRGGRVHPRAADRCSHFAGHFLLRGHAADAADGPLLHPPGPGGSQPGRLRRAAQANAAGPHAEGL
jgi:Cu/Ag efflux pump CusA